MTTGQTLSTNTFGVAKWVVSANATQGTHTMIASALTSASSGDTIFVRDGTYTENITLKAGVSITAAQGDDSIPNVTIIGTCSFSTAGTVNISNIRLQTNSSNLLSVTGSSASVVNLQNCYLNCTNNTGISFTTANASSAITLLNCNGDVGTTGIGLFVVSSTGFMTLDHCDITNSGNTSTASTCSDGQIYIKHSEIRIPMAASSAGVIGSKFSYIHTGTTTPLVFTNSPQINTFECCSIAGGTNSAISIGATSVCGLFSSDINSANTNAITGTGTLQAPSVTFTGASSANDVTTTQPFAFGVTKTFTPVLQFGGASVGITYSAQTGKYWLIGSIVFFDITIILTNKGSSVGSASISNLPFTSANDTHQLTMNIQSNVTFPAGCTALVGELPPNTSSISLQGYGSGTLGTVTNTEFANNSTLLCTGFYWTI